MKCAKLLAPVLVVGLLVGINALAKEGEGGGAKPRANRVAGEITKADAGSVTISKPAGEGGGAATEVTLTIDGNTKIVVDGNAATAADLKAGQKARATYTDAKVATEIVIGQAKKSGEGEGGAKREGGGGERRREGGGER